MARLVGFRHRCPGRHRLPLDGRVVLDARPGVPHSHRAGIDQAVRRDRAGGLPHHLHVRSKGQSTGGQGRVARRQPVPAASQRGRRPGTVAVRYQRPAVDRRPGQARGGDLRRGPAPARRGTPGGDHRSPAGAEVPAARERLRRVDRRLQGRDPGRLELPGSRGAVDRDGAARQPGAAYGSGARDRLALGRSREHQGPRRVRAFGVSGGLDRIASPGDPTVRAVLHCGMNTPGLGESLSHHPLLALVSLFGAGLVTSLTPCIYPMIPITAGILSGTSAGQPSRGRTARLTLAYVTGLALFYAILGLIAGLSGSLFGTVSASPWARFAIGNLLLVFGLAMLDVFPLSAPRRLLAWAAGLPGGAYPAGCLLGATSGIVAAPCGAPAFAAVLTWVASTRSAVLGFVYLFVFSLGMTALLVVVGLFSGALAALPRSGAWMVAIKKAAGVIMLAVAEYYFIQMGKVL